MSRSQRQTLALLLGNAILSIACVQANHLLAGWQLHLWPGGLWVATAVLLAGPGAGAIASFGTGLALDALAPVPFGTHAFVLMAGHAILFGLKLRVARGATPGHVLLALLACGATLSGLTLALAATGMGSVGIGRLFSDTAASLLMTGLLAPWFFALQGRLTELAQTGLREEERWQD